MQLQNAKQRFEARGIRLAAISYDSPAILKDFADRHKIEYPLLADPQSKIIASYGVRNPEATGIMKGMALPGYFYIDASGIIREQYFEAKYTDRFTANNVMAKLFPELAEEVIRRIADYRGDEKHDPIYYARLTVIKAQAQLEKGSDDAQPETAERIDVKH